MADEVYADLLDALSPVTKAGLDPDEAAADRAQTMRTLLGPDDTPKANWYDPPVEEAQNNPPPRPGMSQNGNPLPPGLQVRQPGVPTPDSPPIGSGAPAASSTDGTLFGSPNELQPKAAVPTGATPGGVSPSGSPKPADMTGASAASTALGQSYGRKLLQPADGGQVTAAPDDPTTASPSWADLQRRNVMSGLTNLDKSDQNLQTMQAQPDLATATAPLEQQRVNAQTRQVELQNPYDSNGKLLPEYKPSFGQRLMRGVAGFARGGIIGAVDPAIAGVGNYGAPNKELAIDQTQAAGRVAGADQQLKNASDNWKAASDRAKAQAVEQRANATSRGQLSTEITGQEKVPIEQQNADSETARAATDQQKADQASPEGKTALTQSEFSESQRQADKMGLRGQQRTLYLANGKLPDPRQATDDEIATHQALQIFTQQNGHPPQTVEEYNEVRRAAKGADKQLGPDGQPVATVADRNRASLAHVASDNLDQIEEVINRRPDLLGMIGGRVSNVDQMIGSDDPDLQILGNAAHNFAMANAGIHGSRSFENVKAAEQDLLNNLKSGPNGVRGAIKSNRENLGTIIRRVEGGKGPASDTSHDIVVKPEDMK